MSPLYNPGGGGGGAGSGAVRDQVVHTDVGLAAGAGASGLVALGNSGIVQRVATNRPARVRLYGTVAQRDADVARGAGVDPVGDHGCFLDLVTTGADLDWTLAPPADYADREAVPDGSIAIRVTNLDVGAGDTTVTFDILTLEA